MDVVAVSMPHYMRQKGLKLSEADTPDFVSASFSSPATTARKGDRHALRLWRKIFN